MTVFSGRQAMENAALYSSANSLQRNDAKGVLKELVPTLSITPESRVLDIGCGSGDVTAEVLLPLLPGVDKSVEMIKHARKIFGSSQLRFYQLDIEEETDIWLNLNRQLAKDRLNNNNLQGKHLPYLETVDILINGIKLVDLDDDRFFCEAASCHVKNNNNGPLETSMGADNRFNFIFSIYCLHWVKNQRRALENIYKLMAFGGEAVLVILADSKIFEMYEKMAKTLRWESLMQDLENYISPYHNQDNPARMLCEYAAAAGFQVVSAECQERSYSYENIRALREAVRAVNPYYLRLDTAEGENFLDDCMDVVKNENLSEVRGEQVTVRYSIIVARLRK